MPVPLAHIRFAGSKPQPIGHGRGWFARLPSSHSQPETPADEVEGFPRWLLLRAGLDPRAYRGRPLSRRTPACLRALRVHSEQEAQAAIEADPSGLQAALDALLIGVTEFFRDRPVFEMVREKALPYLVSLPRVRAWSIGCSTGSEVDTLAVMLAEAGLLNRTELLGTDCRASAIETARRGHYRREEIEGLAPGLRSRWFEQVDGLWHAAPELRASTSWRVSDIVAGIEPGPWHLILWRNSAIYLQPAAVARVHARLAAALAPGGFLVLGRAERVDTCSCLHAMSRCVYRKLGDPHD